MQKAAVSWEFEFRLEDEASKEHSEDWYWKFHGNPGFKGKESKVQILARKLGEGGEVSQGRRRCQPHSTHHQSLAQRAACFLC